MNFVMGLAVAVGAPLLLVAYLALVELLLKGLPEQRRKLLRPWLWLTPALALLLLFLVYPVLSTISLSVRGPSSEQFVGLANYAYVFSEPSMLMALRNNVLWLVFFSLLTVTFGLLIAVSTDRLPYEAVVRSVIFLPMAISFVAAGVIWKFMYDYRPPGSPQTGLVNAGLTSLGVEPQAWLINQPFNNLALIAAAVWIWTGFCVVILSAGLKGIPAEILEAARVDGAGEWHVFRQIILPMLGPTIGVVATTMIITALKAFDIVYVMTNGNFETEVIANRMYKEMFNVRDFGRASAIAVVLLAAIVPVMLLNVRRFREQEAMR